VFLLTNPVSDLVNPDYLNVHGSWNKNLKQSSGQRSSQNNKGPGNDLVLKQRWNPEQVVLSWKPALVSNLDHPPSDVDCLDCNLRLVWA